MSTLHRQHLDTSQCAMVAAKMATLKREDTLKRGSVKPDPQICGTATAEAAKLLNVSQRSVESAKQVLEHGSKDLIKAVERNSLD